MAIDLTLNNISSGYNLSKFNENFTAIETAFQDALSRSGTTPNSMNASIDLNGNDLLNVGSLGISGGVSLADIVSYAEEWANKAEDSLVSTAAGGDGVDDYSSLHWAAKAAADAILTAADVVLTNADVVSAEAAKVAAETAAASLNIPVAGAGDAGKYIKVKATEDGYEFDTTVLVDSDIGVNVQAFDSTILVDADIGSTVQSFDANTTKNDTANTFTKTQTWTKGSDVASVAALILGDGNYFDITGTTTIISIGAKGVGTTIKLHFDTALTLTHNATDLILPGAANITTAAGDEAEFVEYASGDWRCTNYQIAATAPDAGGGAVVKVSYAEIQTRGSTAAAIPTDDTIPQNTEGFEILTVTHDRQDAANDLIITGTIHVAASAYGGVVCALFQDTTANALAITAKVAGTADAIDPICFQHKISAGSTGNTTFKIRIGINAGTVYWNRRSSLLYGSTLVSSIKVEEVTP
jgi:hypothetical protein